MRISLSSRDEQDNQMPAFVVIEGSQDAVSSCRSVLDKQIHMYVHA